MNRLALFSYTNVCDLFGSGNKSLPITALSVLTGQPFLNGFGKVSHKNPGFVVQFRLNKGAVSRVKLNAMF